MLALYYLALCITPTTFGALGTEVGAPGYAREACELWFDPTSPSSAVNLATMAFAPAGGFGWGPVGWAELWDQPSGGTRFCPLTLVDPADGVTSRVTQVNAGDVVRISAGGLTIGPQPTPFGTGRFGVGRYGTAPTGVAVMSKTFDASLTHPCEIGAWEPAAIPAAIGIWQPVTL